MAVNPPFLHTILSDDLLIPQVKVDKDEEDASMEEPEEEEEEDWEKALSVERFGDILSDSASSNGDRIGRHYTEKDFESKSK